MKSIFTLLLLLLVSLPESTYASDKELEFQLEDHQKLVGTFSGDIDQKSSIHLVIFKERDAKQYKIRPFFIDNSDRIISLPDVSFEEEPTVVSYHLHPETARLSLLVGQGKRKNSSLEVLDFNLASGEVNRKNTPDFEAPSLTLRLIDKTAFLYIEKDGLKISQIHNSEKVVERSYSFEGEHKEMLKKVFETAPQFVNTNEFVENGSIFDFKLNYEDGKFIFDHKNKKKLTTLVLQPEVDDAIGIRSYDLESLGKVQDVSTYIFGGKIFLFINDGDDLIMKSYDLESGQLLLEAPLLAKYSEYLDKEALEKIIRTSARRTMELTGTVNLGKEGNQLVVTLDYVQLSDYFYNSNWWGNHSIMQHMMMMQNMMQHQQMIQSAQRMRMSSGPSPDLYMGDNLFFDNDASLKLVLDENLNPVKGAAPLTQRPNIDRDKYISPFKDNENLRKVALAFTDHNTRILYYSLSNKTYYLKVFNL